MDGDDSPGRTRPRIVLISDAQSDPVDTDRLRRLAVHVLADRDVPPDVALSVACVDAEEIAALKGRHLGEHAPTDVLAFPMDAPDDPGSGEPMVLGDVVLCPRVAAEQAAQRGVTPADELDLLLVHGILHLLGHDHATEDERTAMFGMTDALLASFRSPAA